MTLHFSSWLEFMPSSVSITGVGVNRSVVQIFFRFCSRCPMVLVMCLSRYLVTYTSVSPDHDLKKPFLIALRYV